MTQTLHSARRLDATAVCDSCGASMTLSRVVAHPEKDGDLHVFECTACKLPVVRFVDR